MTRLYSFLFFLIVFIKIGVNSKILSYFNVVNNLYQLLSVILLYYYYFFLNSFVFFNYRIFKFVFFQYYVKLKKIKKTQNLNLKTYIPLLKSL